ncbi:ArsR/SmtB family transcription factor [Brevibacterium renqingii]|uniref:ArsR/SmtB family transcription factor n=1 Tax=Brevibacterium renqingii TaxID=2776916 RepID=UPI001ADF0805|nr:metalloregulator ArsR/SmtB family transcription factor [Brevibacterium renqingii]
MRTGIACRTRGPGRPNPLQGAKKVPHELRYRTGRAFRALGEPRRRAILELLSADELPAGEVSRRFTEVSAPAVSQHLGVLKDAGLLIEHRDGTRRLYRTSTSALELLCTYLNDLHASSRRVRR